MQMLLKQGEQVLQQPQVEEMKCKQIVVFQFYKRMQKAVFFRQQVWKVAFCCGENDIYVDLLTKPQS